jgi:hypothetical protein
MQGRSGIHERSPLWCATRPAREANSAAHAGASGCLVGRRHRARTGDQLVESGSECSEPLSRSAWLSQNHDDRDRGLSGQIRSDSTPFGRSLATESLLCSGATRTKLRAADLWVRSGHTSVAGTGIRVLCSSAFAAVHGPPAAYRVREPTGLWIPGRQGAE